MKNKIILKSHKNIEIFKLLYIFFIKGVYFSLISKNVIEILIKLHYIAMYGSLLKMAKKINYENCLNY